MPITFFQNEGESFNNVTEDMGFDSSTGWWFSIEADDIDNDADNLIDRDDPDNKHECLSKSRSLQHQVPRRVWRDAV